MKRNALLKDGVARRVLVTAAEGAHLLDLRQGLAGVDRVRGDVAHQHLHDGRLDLSGAVGPSDALHGAFSAPPELEDVVYAACLVPHLRRGMVGKTGSAGTEGEEQDALATFLEGMDILAGGLGAALLHVPTDVLALVHAGKDPRRTAGHLSDHVRSELEVDAVNGVHAESDVVGEAVCLVAQPHGLGHLDWVAVSIGVDDPVLAALHTAMDREVALDVVAQGVVAIFLDRHLLAIADDAHHACLAGHGDLDHGCVALRQFLVNVADQRFHVEIGQQGLDRVPLCANEVVEVSVGGDLPVRASLQRRGDHVRIRAIGAHGLVEAFALARRQTVLELLVLHTLERKVARAVAAGRLEIDADLLECGFVETVHFVDEVTGALERCAFAPQAETNGITEVVDVSRHGGGGVDHAGLREVQLQIDARHALLTLVALAGAFLVLVLNGVAHVVRLIEH